LPNVIKIDPYNFELYRFKVGAFFETQCIYKNGMKVTKRILNGNKIIVTAVCVRCRLPGQLSDMYVWRKWSEMRGWWLRWRIVFWWRRRHLHLYVT